MTCPHKLGHCPTDVPSYPPGFVHQTGPTPRGAQQPLPSATPTVPTCRYPNCHQPVTWDKRTYEYAEYCGVEHMRFVVVLADSCSCSGAELLPPHRVTTGMPYSVLVLPCAPHVGSILAAPTASSVDRPAKRGRRSRHSKCRYRRCHKNTSNGTSSVSTGSHQLWVRSPTFPVPVPSRGATPHEARRHPRTMGHCMTGKVGTSNSHVFRQALRNTSGLLS